MEIRREASARTFGLSPHFGVCPVPATRAWLRRDGSPDRDLTRAAGEFDVVPVGGSVVATGAKMIVTSNPGCTPQIQGSIKKLGHGDMIARHPMEVLDASIRGESVETLFDK